jgi:hypothetical protein
MTRSEQRQEWETRTKDLQSSGQTIPAWCAINNLRVHQVRYRLRKLKRESLSTVNTAPQWLSINIKEFNAECRQPLLIKVGTAVIEVQPGFNPELLRDVVRTLNATC